MKKQLALCLTAAMVISTTSVVLAEHTSEYRYSSEGTSDSWSSETSSAIRATNNNVYGGDVGVNYYYTAVGLAESFVRTTNRRIITQVYENDYWGGHTKARQKEGNFGMSNGYYRPCTWDTGYAYTNKSCIESDGEVELYLDWKVYSVSGDTSSALNAGLLKYKLWVN